MGPQAHRRRRRLWWSGAGVGVLIVALGAFALSAWSVQRHLRQARVSVNQLRADLLARTSTRAQLDADVLAARRATGAARRQTRSPLWAVPAAVPVLGSPVRTVRTATAAVGQLADSVLPELTDVHQQLLAGSLHTPEGGVKLAPLIAARPAVAQADVRVQQILAQVRGLHPSLIGPLDHGRRQLVSQVQGLAGQLQAADAGVRLLPAMLGADGPRRYFLAFQNDAESRGLGGLPGAYAIVRADAGKVSFERFGNDVDFNGLHVADADFGQDFLTHYQGAAPDSIFVNSDISPHFPYAAQLWLRYWQAKTGERLDGALATDPTALAGMLGVTGPTSLPDGTAVSADNVVALTESTAYSRFSDTAARKQFFIAVAKAVADDVLRRGPGQDTALARSLARSVGERRLLAYSTHPDEQAQLAAEPVSGLLPDTAGPFAAIVINNAAGTKLDYYLGRDVRYAGPACHGNVRTSKVTVTLTNHAPVAGLPDYVVVRPDKPPAGTPRGSERLLVGLYATKGAQLASATLDGKQAFLTVESELGRPVYTADVEIPPQASRTLVLYLVEPPTARGRPSSLTQPLVLPQTTELTGPAC